MSSVRDRIRNLQNSNQTTDDSSTSASVAKITRNIESGSTPDTLSSRVAKFDISDSALSITAKTPFSVSSSNQTVVTNQNNAPRLAPGLTSRFSSLDDTSSKLASHGRTPPPVHTSAIKSKFDQPDNIRRTASDSKEESAETVVSNARNIFEQQQKEEQCEDQKNDVDGSKQSFTSRAAVFEKSETEDSRRPNVSNSQTPRANNALFGNVASLYSARPATTDKSLVTSSDLVDNKEKTSSKPVDSVPIMSKAALFERREEQENHNHTESFAMKKSSTSGLDAINNSPELNSPASTIPSPPSLSSRANAADSSANSRIKREAVEQAIRRENSLCEQLEHVKAMNNELVKSIIDLTENYRRLEMSRDSLQKRITDLEASR